MNTDKLLKIHSFYFNRKDNGGEALTITTKFYHNGDPEGVYLNQEISLQSYCNSASINLFGANITADDLRQLANELDRAKIEAIANINKE